MSKTKEVNSVIKPSVFFRKLDLSKLDVNTAEFLRKEVLNDYENIDLLEGTSEFNEIRVMIEENYPQALGIIPVPEKDIEEHISKKTEPKIITGKVNKKEQKELEKKEKEAAKQEHKQKVSEISDLIELMQDTVKGNPNDTDSKDYLELLQDTLADLKKKKFEAGGEVGDDDDNNDNDNDDIKLKYIGELIKQGNTSGYNPNWTLRIDFDGEIDDSDRQHIAKLVSESYTSGEIVSGEESQTGWWSIELGDSMAKGGAVGETRVEYKGLTLLSFKNVSDFQKWIRKNNKTPDFVQVSGIVYTQDNYDLEGQEITYGNVTESKMLTVKTENRYNKSIGFSDAVVEEDVSGGYRNDIRYLDKEEMAKGGAVGKLKISQVKKGDLLKKKGSAIEVEVIGVGNEWQSGHHWVEIHDELLNTKTKYIDISDFVLSDGSPYPQYANGGGVGGDKKYIMTSYSGSIVEDSYEEGEIGNSVSDFDLKESKTFNSKKELVDYMNKLMYVDYKEEHFDWETGEGKSIHTDVTVSMDKQGNFFPADAKEKELWKQGKKKLYNCHYWFYVVPVTVHDEYAKGGGVGEPKISYNKYWSKHDGTVYDQKVKIDRATFEKLKDAVQSEIALKYPRKSEYVSTSGYEFYLKPLVIESNGVVELNNTQARFINLFLKLPLKDRNTRLYVVNKYEDGGGVGNEEEIKERLEYLRGELRAERISQGELIELESLAKHIDPSDVELLEAAGVPEFNDSEFEGKFVYKFHEERGEISAYVENMATGEEVWSFKYPDYSLPEDEREFQSTPVDDGFMRHWEDISGLENYLKDLGAIPNDAQILSESEANKIGFYKNGGGIRGWFSRKPKENVPHEYEVFVTRKDGSTNNPIFGSLQAAQNYKSDVEGLGYKAEIKPVFEKGGSISDHYVQVNDLFVDKKTFAVTTREDVKKYQGTSLEDATAWANAQYSNEGSTYKYYKVPNEQLWAVQECNSAFNDGHGGTCIVIKTKKTEQEAIALVKRLTELQAEADSKMAKGGEVSSAINDALTSLDAFVSFWNNPPAVEAEANDISTRLILIKGIKEKSHQIHELTTTADRIGRLYTNKKVVEDSLGSLASALDSLNSVIDKKHSKGGEVKNAVTYYVAWSSWFDTNKYDVEKITKALEEIGATDIHLENERGWSNQPEVVVFKYKGDGTDYAPTKAVQKELGTDWVIVRVKDWKKNHENGGDVGKKYYIHGGEIQEQIDFYDGIVKKLKKSGIKVEAKYFDQYQGVYLSTPKGRIWTVESFFRGKVKKSNAKYRSAVLIDEMGDQYSATRGDYFQHGQDYVFEDNVLVLVTIDGKEKRIKDPKVSDMPDLLEVRSSIEYEKGTETQILVLSPEKDNEVKFEVVIDEKGNVDADELIEYLKSKEMAKGGGVESQFNSDTHTWFDGLSDLSSEMKDNKNIEKLIAITNKAATRKNVTEFKKILKKCECPNPELKKNIVAHLDKVLGEKYKGEFKFSFGGNRGSGGKASAASEFFSMFNQAATYNYAKGGSLKNKERVEIVLKHYLIAALWSSTDSDNEDTPFDTDYDTDDFDKKTVDKARQLIVKFMMDNEADLKASGLNDEQIGHDLWLTQVGHGAGFWDRDGVSKEVGDRLSKESKRLGQSAYLYAENGVVYIDGLTKIDEYSDGGKVSDNTEAKKKVTAEIKKRLAEKYAKGGKIGKDAGLLTETERFELKVLQGLSGFNNGQTLNGLLESMGLSNYRLSQYASKSELGEVNKSLSSLIKKGFVNESGLGYKITQTGADYLRSFNYGTYAKGGSVGYKRFKGGTKVRVDEAYLNDEASGGNATATATVIGEPINDEDDVQIQYENGMIDYLDQQWLEPIDEMAKGGDVWIKDALSGGKNKGALRRTAMRKGLLRNEKENLSKTDLHKLEKMGGKTSKRAYLAETLSKFDTGGGVGKKYGVYVFGKLDDDFSDELVANEYARLMKSTHPKYKVEVKPIK